MKKLLFIYCWLLIYLPSLQGQCLETCTLGVPPVNDICSLAEEVILAPPPPCPSSGAGLPSVITGTNICATAEIPYTGISGCKSGGNMPAPAASVWYKITLSGTALNVKLDGGINTPVIGLWEDAGLGCGNLIPINCYVGEDGTINTSFSPLNIGTYYLQVSGGNEADQCDFTLKLQNNNDCTSCLASTAFSVDPPPIDGEYAPNTTVKFCYTVSGYNQTNTNWLHGVVPVFGSGWDESTLVPIPPPACNTDGTWSWYDELITGTATGQSAGPGFFYELSHDPNNPGDNYGDEDVGNSCSLEFCWSINAKSVENCQDAAPLSMVVNTYSDSETGSWQYLACENDPDYSFLATVFCCDAPLLSDIFDETFCEEAEPITLTAMGQNIDDYLWMPGGQTTQSITVFPTETTTYTVTASNDCDVVSDEVTISYLPTADPFWEAPDTICASSKNSVLLPLADSGGTWFGEGVQDNGDGTATLATENLAGAVDVTYTVGIPPCEESLTRTIIIQPIIDADWNVPLNLCQNENTLVLSTLAENEGGIWKGEGVTQLQNETTIFDFSALTGEISIAHIIPNGLCSDTVTRTITIHPTPDATWLAPQQVCQVDTNIALLPLADMTGIWSGDGVIDNGDGTASFNPINLTDSSSITYTIHNDFCSVSNTKNIFVQTIPSVNWELPENVCATGESILLTPIDSTSNGVWSGDGITDNGDGTAIFDPSATANIDNVITYSVGTAPCIEELTQTLTVIYTPESFTSLQTVCSDTSLLLTSIASTTGSWLGDGITDNGDGTATFEPHNLTGNIFITYIANNQGCIDSIRQTINVVPIASAAWENPETVCANNGIITLTATEDATGIWFGEGITDNGDGTAIFDPNDLIGDIDISYLVGQLPCITTLTQTINVLPPADASWENTIPACTTGEPILLIPTGTAGGTWSGESIVDNGDGTATFDPTGLTGTIDITYTVGESPCLNSNTQTINILPTVSANWKLPDSPCSTGEPIMLTPTGTTGGNWSGEGITDNGDGTATFDPTDLTGAIDITYTIGESPCDDKLTQSLLLIPEADATWEIPLPLCSADEPVLLTATDTVNGHWSGEGITNNEDGTAMFDPTNLVGEIEVTYTTGVLPCIDTLTQPITVMEQEIASWATTSICEAEGSITLSPNLSTNGLWSGEGITNNGDGTATFNPIGLAGEIAITYLIDGICGDTLTQNIAVTSNPDPSWEVPSICSHDDPIILQASETIGGTWSGNGITNNDDGSATFDPTNLTGNIEVTYTIGSASCQQSATQTISILPSPIASWDAPVAMCTSEPAITLTANENLTGVWSGNEIIDNGNGTATFTPSNINDTEAVVTYSVSAGNGCVQESTQTISILTAENPSWEAPTNICAADGIINLAAIESTTGSWIGQGITDNGDGTAIFDPSLLSGEIIITYVTGASTLCEQNQSSTIQVIEAIEPVWEIPTSICSTDLPFLLTNNSQGIWSGTGIIDVNTGLFDPSIVTGSTDITYTITNDFCIQNFTQTINVNFIEEPLWESPIELCVNEGNILLTPLIVNTLGTWSGDGITDNGDGTATFDPTGHEGAVLVTFTTSNGDCVAQSTQTITVVSSPNAFWEAPTNLCNTAGAINLANTATEVGGTWTGPGIVNEIVGLFNPFGLGGEVAITYTVGSGGCIASSTQIINVNTPPTANWALPEPVICSRDEPMILSPSLPNTIGTWSGNGITNNQDGTATFDPTNLDGPIEIVFTTSSGDCTQSVPQTINVLESPSANWTVPTGICDTDISVDLNEMVEEEGGSWASIPPNMISSTGLLNTNIPADSILITYKTGNWNCKDKVSQYVVIHKSPTASFTADLDICANGDSIVIVSYTGSANTESANFLWDFDGGNATALGNENYQVSWSTTTNGTATISLQVEENGCTALPFSFEVELVAPLSTPIVLCEEATEGSVTFKWNPIPTATKYRVNILAPVEEEGAIEITESKYEIFVNAGTMVTVVVEALSNTICSESLPSLPTSCVAQNCPVNPISFDWPTDICATENSFELSAAPTGVVISGEGVINNTFDPSNLVPDDYQINMTYVDETLNCSYSLNHLITVHPTPTATFSTSDTQTCITGDNPIIVTYTGSANPTANFEWDFGEAVVTDLGNQQYALVWLTAGNKNISLQVTEENCSSEIETIDITVVPTPSPLVITCGTTNLTSVAIVWEEIPNIQQYDLAYSIDEGELIENGIIENENSYTVANLTEGSNVTFYVTPIGNFPCTNLSPTSFTCQANTCPSISPIITAPTTNLCSIDEPITLVGSPIGGTFSGNGVTADGLFTPSLPNAGGTITYTYLQEDCEYTATIEVQVNDIPQGQFVITTNEICADNVSSIQGIYIGGGDLGQTYHWLINEDTVAISTTPVYQYTFDDNVSSPTNIGLIVENNGCFSMPLVEPITLHYPLTAPILNCETGASDFVSISWENAAIVDSYILTYQINDGEIISLDINTTAYTVSNLSPNDEVAFSVQAQSNTSCVASEISTINCMALSCPTITPTIIGLEDNYCVGTNNLLGSLSFEPTGGIITIDGVIINDLLAGENLVQTIGLHNLVYTVTQSDCSYSTSKDFNIYPIPTADFTVSDTIICENDLAEITVNYTGTSEETADFQWDWGNATVLTGSGSGPYTIALPNNGSTTSISLTVAANNCTSTTKTQEIHTLASPIPPVVNCAYSTDSTITFVWEAINNATFYGLAWTVNETTAFTDTITTTTYTIPNVSNEEEISLSVVTIDTSATFCPASETNTATCIVQNCEEISLNLLDVPVIVCETDEDINLQAMPAGGNFTIDNIPASIFSPSSLPIGHHVIGYEYLDEQNCLYTLAQNIEIIPLPTATFDVPTHICVNESLEVAIEIDTNLVTNYTWIVDGLNGLPTQTFYNEIPTGNWTNMGTYTLELILENEACSQTFTQEVTVVTIDIAPLTPITTLQNKTIEISPTIIGTYEQIDWFTKDGEEICTDCETFTFYSANDETYEVIATNEYGCTASQTVAIEVNTENKILIPTGFSPNGDGINDVFTIRGQNIVDLSFHVFDRWGVEIFTLNNHHQQNWDGTHKNRNKDVGTYVYYGVVTFEDGTIEKLQGNILLIR